MKKLANIILNGVSHFGRKLRIENRNHDTEVYVDGKRVDISGATRIDIIVHGNLESLDVGSAVVQVSGNAGSVRTGSGSVTCAEVSGDVSTGSGDVTCGHVAGSVTTASGDVDCHTVNGSIRTVSGNISARRG